MNDKSTLQALAAVATILALFVAIIGLFIHNNSTPASPNTQSGAAPTSAISQATSSPPGGTGSVLAASSPTGVPTSRTIAAGTELCGADATRGWSGWSLGSSWHVVAGTLVNDGKDNSGTFTPNLLPPDSCQGQVADIAVKAQIKVDALGYGGFGLDSRGQNTANGWGGYALWMYVACYDTSNSSCITPNLDEVDYDPESNQLGTGHYDVGSAFHNYELDVRGNSITVKIDGATILSATDNSFLASGQVGIFCKDNTQIEVRSVHVVAL